MDRLRASPPSSSLRVLEQARLVTRRKVGREYRLRFRPEPLVAIQEWISQQQAFWRAGLEAMDAMLSENNGKEGPTE